MGQSLFLTLFYFLGLCLTIPKIPFLRNTGLKNRELYILLSFKVACSLFAAAYLTRYSDYLGYNIEGMVQYQLLLSNPRLFFTDFKNDINTYGLGGLFDSSYSFWAYLRFNLLYKFIAILNIVSGGNFYLNSAIFSSMVFFGHIAFYRVYQSLYPGKKAWILTCCFLLPSLMLYTSCVHKDGIIFLSLGLLSFVISRWLQSKGALTATHIVFFCAGIFILFLFRNYLLLALLPALFTAVLCRYVSWPRSWIIGLTYGLYVVMFFVSKYIVSFLDLPAILIKRKEDFMLVKEAHTNIAMGTLEPTFISFLGKLPQALNHAFMRPYVWEFSNAAVILSALELLCYQIILVIALVSLAKKKPGIKNFNVFGFCFFLNVMLIIGYTIPNIGAIVRYRSIFWIFLLCPLLCNINWKQLPGMRRSRNEG